MFYEGMTQKWYDFVGILVVAIIMRILGIEEDYCILEIVAEAGRYYRYDGKGDLTSEEIRTFDAGKKYENGYDKANRG